MIADLLLAIDCCEEHNEKVSIRENTLNLSTENRPSDIRALGDGMTQISRLAVDFADGLSKMMSCKDCRI